jgi:catechol 2,3-dioxygenase-like lactoylglutathione lyase family enzyme
MKIKSVVETAFYVDDLQATENFYHTFLGLPIIGREPDHHVFFQVGEADVLLAFVPKSTQKGDHLPPHGASGPGHFALGIETADFDGWQKLLESHGVVVEREMAWPRGGRSLYFRDPAGNLVELITPTIWGLPSGW